MPLRPREKTAEMNDPVFVTAVRTPVGKMTETFPRFIQPTCPPMS